MWYPSIKRSSPSASISQDKILATSFSSKTRQLSLRLSHLPLMIQTASSLRTSSSSLLHTIRKICPSRRQISWTKRLSILRRSTSAGQLKTRSAGPSRNLSCSPLPPSNPKTVSLSCRPQWRLHRATCLLSFNWVIFQLRRSSPEESRSSRSASVIHLAPSKGDKFRLKDRWPSFCAENCRIQSWFVRNLSRAKTSTISQSSHS